MAKKPRDVQKKNPPRNFFTGNVPRTRTAKTHISRGGDYGDKGQPAKKALTTNMFPFKGEFEARWNRETQARENAEKDISAGRSSSHQRQKKLPRKGPPLPRKRPERY